MVPPLFTVAHGRMAMLAVPVCTVPVPRKCPAVVIAPVLMEAEAVPPVPTPEISVVALLPKVAVENALRVQPPVVAVSVRFAGWLALGMTI